MGLFNSNRKTTFMGFLEGLLNSVVVAHFTQGLGWKQAAATVGAGLFPAIRGLFSKDHDTTGGTVKNE